ncbi:MAG TPA: MoxR family ATPase [Firmicutes bacterium]|jgi:MoxR-like ATPase|nr:MoxR family ATPase [Bacillota bacterium]HOQ24691.1 MoxR family ATPase [Bacillota bacterium]HPT68279.1 MoxR family ATPase [Bacillota bacterium]
MANLVEWGDTVRQRFTATVIGNDQILQEILVGMLAGGHVLLEGVPGVGKTLIVKTLARILGVGFHRIQFTPDLMPTDILGTNIFDPKSLEFQLRLGPVFTNFLLADEINRTPPRTQAALLEAMEERQVTIDGVSHPLPRPFMVFATQNPVEYEGTFPLPEAQLDRFMLKIIVPYPSAEEEAAILKLHAESGDATPEPQPLENGLADLTEAMAAVAQIQIEDKILDYINRLIRTTRENPRLLLGASPRSGVHMVAASRAMAFLAGRDFVVPDDVKAVFLPVLRHRILLRPEAEMEGFHADEILRQILSAVAVPR